MLERTLVQWGGRKDLQIFAYASLIWRPDFEVHEHLPAHVHGWHRALRMWSRINRGTPDNPGLVFALLSGGSCRGMVLRVKRHQGEEVLRRLWEREMMTGVYDPRWLPCITPRGTVQALAFTLSRASPNYTGELSPLQYREIFARSSGRYGTTHDYALQTFHSLKARGIHDRALEKILAHATKAQPDLNRAPK
jgi:cation transport protein ChaC